MKQWKMKGASKRIVAGVSIGMGLLAACAACAVGAVGVASAADEPANPAVVQGNLQEQQSTDRLIVKYRDQMALQSTTGDPRVAQRLQALQSVAQRHDVQLGYMRSTGTQANVMKLSRNLSIPAADALARDIAASDPDVAYAEADRMAQPQAFIPNDPDFPRQWNYSEPASGIHLPGAWSLSTGTGVVVAVLDTGYRPHADLVGNIVGGYDFVSDPFTANDGDGWDSDAQDTGDGVRAGECTSAPQRVANSTWHGTRVAGVIAARANNGIGIAGVAFNARVLPVRVLGRCGSYASDLADALVWAAGGTVSGVPANAYPARVINMSLNNVGVGACNATTQDAIDFARSRNAVVVAIAGNQRSVADNYAPGNCAGVISVAAVNRAGGRAGYSNAGSSVTVAAPGGDIFSGSRTGIADYIYALSNTGQYAPNADGSALSEGTSMAAPQVAGVAALMLSANPKLTPDEVKALLQKTARPFPVACEGCGSGIVDAAAAVAAAVYGEPEVVEVEMNDTKDYAQPLGQGGGAVNGTIQSEIDTDFFKVVLPVGQTLSAMLSPNASSDYDLFFYHRNGVELRKGAGGVGEPEQLLYANVGRDSLEIYMRVVSYKGGLTGSAGRYKLHWKISPNGASPGASAGST